MYRFSFVPVALLKMYQREQHRARTTRCEFYAAERKKNKNGKFAKNEGRNAYMYIDKSLNYIGIVNKVRLAIRYI